MKVENNSRKWLITCTAMLGSIMVIIDASIVNVTLPVMRGSFGASVEEITWIVTGYILSNVIAMPMAAYLSARFGRKRFVLFSVGLFTFSSILCGLAWSLNSMILFRVLQGFGGGALQPISQSILRETFPPSQQGTAMGIFGLGTVLGPTLGPTLGGWITDNYTWPWIFYINVPVGIINMLMIIRFIEDPPYLERVKGRPDYAGLFFIALGLGTLLIMLEKGNQKDWFSSNFIVSIAILSASALILFIWRELSAEKPAVNIRILKDLNFASATGLGGVFGMALFGWLFLLPIFLQQVLGYSAQDAGTALLPRGLAMIIAMPLAGRLYNSLGPRILLAVGSAIIIVSSYQLSLLTLDVGYWEIFAPQFGQGIAFSMIFVGLTTAGLSTIEPRNMTSATGLFNVTRHVFGSLGIALAGTLLARGESVNRAMLTAHISLDRDVTAETLRALSGSLISKGVDPLAAGETALKLLDNQVMRQAAMLSFNNAFFLVTAAFVLTLPLIFFIRDVHKDRADRTALIQE